MFTITETISTKLKTNYGFKAATKDVIIMEIRSRKRNPHE